MSRHDWASYILSQCHFDDMHCAPIRKVVHKNYKIAPPDALKRVNLEAKLIMVKYNLYNKTELLIPSNLG